MCLVLNQAVISLELVVSQLTRAFSACLDSMYPTHSFSMWCPIVSVARVQYKLSRGKTELTCLNLFCFCNPQYADIIAPHFHRYHGRLSLFVHCWLQVSISVCCLGERRIGRASSCCCWLSLLGVIRSDEPLPARQRMCVWCFCVSVTI